MKRRQARLSPRKLNPGAADHLAPVRPRDVDEAAKYLPLDQLALSPQCGFSSTVAGNRLSVEEQAAKSRLVVEVAREVWG